MFKIVMKNMILCDRTQPNWQPHNCSASKRRKRREDISKVLIRFARICDDVHCLTHIRGRVVCLCSWLSHWFVVVVVVHTHTHTHTHTRQKVDNPLSPLFFLLALPWQKRLAAYKLTTDATNHRRSGRNLNVMESDSLHSFKIISKPKQPASFAFIAPKAAARAQTVSPADSSNTKNSRYGLPRGVGTLNLGADDHSRSTRPQTAGSSKLRKRFNGTDSYNANNTLPLGSLTSSRVCVCMRVCGMPTQLIIPLANRPASNKLNQSTEALYTEWWMFKSSQYWSHNTGTNGIRTITRLQSRRRASCCSSLKTHLIFRQ